MEITVSSQKSNAKLKDLSGPSEIRFTQPLHFNPVSHQIMSLSHFASPKLEK